MRKLQSLGVAFLAFLLVAAHVVWRPTTQAQTTTVSAARAALERGYRTGYSDGYQEGFRDIQDNKAEEFRNNPDYINAARAYEAKHGPRESYRDGYQQGYGKGYADVTQQTSTEETKLSNCAQVRFVLCALSLVFNC